MNHFSRSQSDLAGVTCSFDASLSLVYLKAPQISRLIHVHGEPYAVSFQFGSFVFEFSSFAVDFQRAVSHRREIHRPVGFLGLKFEFHWP